MKAVEEPDKKKEGEADESLNDQENGPEMIIQVSKIKMYFIVHWFLVYFICFYLEKFFLTNTI